MKVKVQKVQKDNLDDKIAKAASGRMFSNFWEGQKCKTTSEAKAERHCSQRSYQYWADKRRRVAVFRGKLPSKFKHWRLNHVFSYYSGPQVLFQALSLLRISYILLDGVWIYLCALPCKQNWFWSNCFVWEKMFTQSWSCKEQITWNFESFYNFVSSPKSVATWRKYTYS